MKRKAIVIAILVVIAVSLGAYLYYYDPKRVVIRATKGRGSNPYADAEIAAYEALQAQLATQGRG